MKFQRVFYLILIEPLLKNAKNILADLILKRHYRNVLEVGCGTCRQAEMLAKRNIKVTAIDISESLFPEHLQPFGKGQINFFKADARKLPFQDETFDASIISLALHEMDTQDRIPVLNEMKRVTKNTGKIFILDYQHNLKHKTNFAIRLIVLIEKLAGKKHYGNFCQFIENGGTPSLAKKIGKKITLKVPVLGGGGAIFELSNGEEGRI